MPASRHADSRGTSAHLAGAVESEAVAAGGAAQRLAVGAALAPAVKVQAGLGNALQGEMKEEVQGRAARA